MKMNKIKIEKKKKSKQKLIKVILEFMLLFVIILMIFLLFNRFNRVYSINVLAVSNHGSFTPKGSIAKIYLAIRPGSGNIFVDTAPLTALDLQASIRNSNKLACEFVNEDCSKYDFFYRVDSNSYLVSGPSASMAIAVLTVAALKNLDINQSVSVTGTINSGYLIGPVGGLYEKVKSTFNTNIDLILIPFGQTLIQKNNKTINLTYYANFFGNKTVKEIVDLSDALYYFTGKRFVRDYDINFSDFKYVFVMENVASKLCNRTKTLLNLVTSLNINESDDNYRLALKFYNDSILARNEGNYYAEASFCFSANPRLFYFVVENMSDEEKEELVYFIREKISLFKKTVLSKSFESLGDLQIKGVVNSRIEEAEEELNKYLENHTNTFSLAFSFERLYSAALWSKFFGLDKKKLTIDDEYLKMQCKDMIYELNSMKQVLSFYVPLNNLKGIDIHKVEKYYDNKKYDICLFEALKARAKLNVYQTYLFVNKAMLNQTIAYKLLAALREIKTQTMNGHFPLVAYSYYTYAKQLASQNESYSAILFSEYAIELAKMDLFIAKKNNFSFNFNMFILFFTLGVVLGLLINDLKK